MMLGITRTFKGTAFFAVLFICLMILNPVRAQEATGQIVLVNNVALKMAQSMTMQIYKVNAKGQSVLKSQYVTANEDCTNGCGYPWMAVNVPPGQYKIQVFGSVVLENVDVSFPVHAGDEFVWMLSNRDHAPRMITQAPGIVIKESKSQFRVDLVTYTKGNVAAVPAPVAKHKSKKLKAKSAGSYISN